MIEKINYDDKFNNKHKRKEFNKSVDRSNEIST